MSLFRLLFQTACPHGNFDYCHEREPLPGFEPHHVDPPVRRCAGGETIDMSNLLKSIANIERDRSNVMIMDKLDPQSFSDSVESINQILSEIRVISLAMLSKPMTSVTDA